MPHDEPQCSPLAPPAQIAGPEYTSCGRAIWTRLFKDRSGSAPLRTHVLPCCIKRNRVLQGKQTQREFHGTVPWPPQRRHTRPKVVPLLRPHGSPSGMVDCELAPIYGEARGGIFQRDRADGAPAEGAVSSQAVTTTRSSRCRQPRGGTPSPRTWPRLVFRPMKQASGPFSYGPHGDKGFAFPACRLFVADGLAALGDPPAAPARSSALQAPEARGFTIQYVQLGHATPIAPLDCHRYWYASCPVLLYLLGQQE